MVDKKAKKLYERVCKVQTTLGWQPERFDEDMVTRFVVQNEILPIGFVIYVDPELKQLCVASQLVPEFSKDQLEDAALAVCHISNNLGDGCFELDPETGKVAYRISACYDDCYVGEDLIYLLISRSLRLIQRVIVHLMHLAMGEITLAEFKEKV
jgi:hypothetical protein